MKDLDWVVPNKQNFKLSDELFSIELADLQRIMVLGPVISRFMSAMQTILYIAVSTNLKLVNSYSFIRNILLWDINTDHKKLVGVHPQRNSLLTRIDFMVSENSELKIAEIDPMNKHGLGFALLCRNESGHSERQKILTLFSELVNGYEDLSIIISRKDEFFHQEQEYFARKLGEFSGKPTCIITERCKGELIKKMENPASCFLDCPVLDDANINQRLLHVFNETPKRFLVPPKHWMANKALMAFLYEPVLLKTLRAFLDDKDIDLLQQHIPPTYTTNPNSEGFIVKKVMSSGAKGVFFNGNAPDKGVIYQQYVHQKKYVLDGMGQHIRLAAHFVGVKLGELTVTSSAQVPVHGGSNAVNYHVVLKVDKG